MIKLKIIATVIAAMLFLNASARSLSNQEKALQFMNHITFMVAKINAYGTTTELEEIYNQHLSDRLGLDYVVDENAMIAIRQILNLLNEMRMNEGDRNILSQELEIDKQAALYRAIPSPQSIIAANPLAIGINLLQGAISGYASYKMATAEINKRGLKRNWDLDKEKLKALNRYNMDLIDCFWRLVDKYKVDYSSQHVTTEDIAGLFSAIKESDVDARNLPRTEVFLQNFSERFEHFPLYWYYRGVIAQRLGKDEDALGYYAEYRNRRLPIFVHDKVYADYAIAVLTIRKKLGRYGWFNNSEIRDLISIVEKNCGQADWEKCLFAGLAASDMLGDSVVARRLVEKATFAAEKVYRDAWRKCEWNEDACEDGELYKIPSADAVITCKEVWMNVVKDKTDVLDGLAKAISQGVASNHQTALETLRMELALKEGGRTTEKLKEIVDSVLGFKIRYERKWFRNNRLRLKMPVQWMYAKRCKYSVCLYDADGNQVGDETQSYLGWDHQFGAEGNCRIELIFDVPRHSEVMKVRFLKLKVNHDHIAYALTFAFPADLTKLPDFESVRDVLNYSFNVKRGIEEVKRDGASALLPDIPYSSPKVIKLVSVELIK